MGVGSFTVLAGTCACHKDQSPLQEAVGARPSGDGDGDRTKGADQHDSGSKKHHGYSTAQIQGSPVNQRVETVGRAVRQIGVPKKGLGRNWAGTSLSAIPADPQPPQEVTDRIDPSSLPRLCRSA